VDHNPDDAGRDGRHPGWSGPLPVDEDSLSQAAERPG
jgi:hypothetical protein